MNNLKNKTVGNDTPIQLFQKFLYDSLKKIWTKVDDLTLEGYGRVYRNANDIGYVPEVLVNSALENNTQYKQVYFDKTTMKALFFFSTDDLAKYSEGSETVNVSIIFITNISTLKPYIEHRGDEEVRNDVQSLLSQNRQNMILKGSETGFKNVFKQFSGLTNKDGEVFEDRHPLFCFKFNMELFYQPNNTDC
jgi:hypothetical protein